MASNQYFPDKKAFPFGNMQGKIFIKASQISKQGFMKSFSMMISDALMYILCMWWIHLLHAHQRFDVMAAAKVKLALFHQSQISSDRQIAIPKFISKYTHWPWILHKKRSYCQYVQIYCINWYQFQKQNISIFGFLVTSIEMDTGSL